MGNFAESCLRVLLRSRRSQLLRVTEASFAMTTHQLEARWG
jgi:hypothetical protein